MAEDNGPLLTDEDYARLEDDGRITELIRGRVIEYPFHTMRHGLANGKLCCLIDPREDVRSGRSFVGTGIITERNPDTVRGADLSFFRTDRLPANIASDDWFAVGPDLTFEILESWDRWSDMLARASEYLHIGSTVVSILDPSRSTIHVFRADVAPRILGPDDEWSAPEILSNFSVPVRQFFE